MRSRRRRAGLISLLALGLASCGPGTANAPAGLDPVRVAVVPYLTLAPVFIARAEGYFTDAGLDVEFVRLARNQEIMAALATGQVDVSAGMLTVNEMALALQGARVRLVAAMGEFASDACTFGAIIARRGMVESGALQDPARLRTLTLDSTALIPFDYWVDEVLAPLGLTTDDLETVDLPSSAAVAAMVDGSIDLTIDTEPNLSLLLASGEAAVWVPIEQIAPGYVLSMLVYGPTLLDERPGVGERFATAVLRGIRQFRKGKTPRNLEIVAGDLGLEPAVAERLCWPPMRADGRIDPAVFRGYEEWSVAHGLIDRVPRDDELFDHRFIDRANAELDR